MVGNRILSNSIYSNGALSIELQCGVEDSNRVTANDKKDPDKGVNRLQNYPRLQTAISDGAKTTITGKLNSTPKKDFIIQFFSNTADDPSGFGEGETFLGSKTVTTNGKGNVSFTMKVNKDLQGTSVTATATRVSTGDTSEFSELKDVDAISQ